MRHFGKNLRLSEITVASIYGFQHARQEQRVGKATINRDIYTLSKCLKRAKNTGLISHNPCSDVDMLDEKGERRQGRPLSYEEEDRLKQFSPPKTRALIGAIDTARKNQRITSGSIN